MAVQPRALARHQPLLLASLTIAASLATATTYAQNAPQPAPPAPPRPAPAPQAAAAREAPAADVKIIVLAFSPNGLALVGGLSDHTIKIWDPANGRTMQGFDDHTGPVQAVHFTADGNWLLTAAKEIKRWTASKRQLAETIDLENFQQPRSALFSPDGKWLASIAGENRLLIHNATTGRRLPDLQVDGQPISLAFTPDAKSIAVGTHWIDRTKTGATIQFFDVATGAAQRTIDAPGISVTALAFTTAGHQLAYAGLQTVKVLNTLDGRLIREFPGHIGSVNSLAFSPDGNTLASGGQGPGLQLPTEWMLMSETKHWDMKTGKLLWANVGELVTVRAIAFSPDGSRMARADDRSLLVQPLADGRLGWLRYINERGRLAQNPPEPLAFVPVGVGAQGPGAALKNAATNQVALLKAAIDTFQVTTNTYPSDLTDLVKMPADARLAQRWAGPYILNLQKDPWGIDFRYVEPGFFNPTSFDVSSAGPDGKHGTADDIGNWKVPPPAPADAK